MKPKRESKKESGHSASGAPKEKGVVKYGECMKNHAASIGRHAVDGCREFMAGGGVGTADPLLCAACGCHRSFHRRVVEGEEHLDECSSNSSS